jgi:hypothetical protein
MTDFRALCAELLQALETEGYAHWTQAPNEDELCLRVRAALAQPELPGPKLIYRYSPVTIAECGGPCEQGPQYCDCGQIKGEPKPQEVTDEELLGIEDLEATWNAQADAFNSWDKLGIDEIVWWAQRQALARSGRPTVEPVPVSERFEFSVLDGEYEEQAGGTATTYSQALSEGQHYLAMYSQDGPHSLELRRVEVLPHWALPVPKVNNTGKTND